MKVDAAALLMVAAICVSASACRAGGGDSAQSGERRAASADVVRGYFDDPEIAALAAAACDGDRGTLRATPNVDPNSLGRNGATLLVAAMACRSLPGVEAILELGADPNLDSGAEHGQTPVFLAANMEDSAFLATLLRHGGDPNSSAEGGQSALMAALGRGIDGHWQNYYALLAAGADFNRRHGSTTVAEDAAIFNQYDKVAELLERGYTRDLLRLGRFLETSNTELMPHNQILWANRVRVMLEARGVRFPINPADVQLTGREP